MEGKHFQEFKDIDYLPEKLGKRVLTTGGHFGYLKIAEGCDKHCTYCIIPKLRGKFRSVPMERLVTQAKEMAEEGVKELILVAQETTVYGTDIYGKKSLHILLKELCKIKGIRWIRVLYCYPEIRVVRSTMSGISRRSLFTISTSSACIIPKLRGKFRSVPMERLVTQAKEMAEEGVKELILVAQETTVYGTDIYGKKSLHILLKELCKIKGIRWIRVLYCYPEIRVVRSTMSGISRRSLFTISTSSACVVLLPILFKIRSLACWIGRSQRGQT